jgi:hypothetical protein
MAEKREVKAVLTLPDIGLKDSEIEHLKTRFHNDLVESARAGLYADEIIIVVVVVVIRGPRPREE